MPNSTNLSRRSFLKLSLVLGAVGASFPWQRRLLAFNDLSTVFWDDFSTLQPNWIGIGFNVVDGNAMILPLEGEEHSADGSFEEWDDAGKLVNWITQTAGTSMVSREDTTVHGGKFALRYSHDADDSQGRVYQTSSMPGDTFHILRCWARASEVGTRLAISGTALGLNDNPTRELTTAFQEFIANGRSTDINGQIFPDIVQGANTTVYLDELSLKDIDFPSMFALRKTNLSENVVSKATLVVVPGTYAGVAAFIDDPESPQNGLMAYLNQYSARLTKCVDGAFSDIISPTGITYIEGAPLEIRKAGKRVTLFYNGKQIVDTQTVADVGAGKYHGIFSAFAGNRFNDFVYADRLDTLKISWAGTSFTASNPGYSYVVDGYISNNFPLLTLTAQHGATDGHNTWSNLVRLDTDILSIDPDVVVIDMVNDPGGNHSGKSLEAFVRRVWSANPNTRIIFVKAFSVSDVNDNTTINNPIQLANGEFAELDSIAQYYGIPVVDYWSAVKELVNNKGHNLTEYVSGDSVHPAKGGYALLASLVEQVMPEGGAKKPSSYPDRIYDTLGDYENIPIRVPGIEYESRSGNWTDDETQVSSSEVGSTITYSAICQSFGCYRKGRGAHEVEISIDGGDFVAMPFYQNGTGISGGRARHTITIRLTSGTLTIDEFWAI
ncbi:MAG: hypothetical protein R3E39_22580 [Anaerolineae bacterium]